jgi:hypothetical protein
MACLSLGRCWDADYSADGFQAALGHGRNSKRRTIFANDKGSLK